MDADIYKDFEIWFLKDIDGDEEFSGVTAQQVTGWASRQRPIRHVGSDQARSFLEELLALPSSGASFREFFYRNHVAEPHPFPTARRIGGDHDRGFSPALNAEMAHRAAHADPKVKPNRFLEGQGPGPLRPPLKDKT
jgi:hypothetical protein